MFRAATQLEIAAWENHLHMLAGVVEAPDEDEALSSSEPSETWTEYTHSGSIDLGSVDTDEMEAAYEPLRDLKISDSSTETASTFSGEGSDDDCQVVFEVIHLD